MTTKRDSRPITALPHGSRFVVETRGLRHMQHKVKKGVGVLKEIEEVSDNHLEQGEGCYRTQPVLYDE